MSVATPRLSSFAFAKTMLKNYFNNAVIFFFSLSVKVPFFSFRKKVVLGIPHFSYNHTLVEPLFCNNLFIVTVFMLFLLIVRHKCTDFFRTTKLFLKINLIILIIRQLK